MNINQYDVDLDTIKVGTWIGFKSDIEQTAEVIEIKRERSWNGSWQTVFVTKAPDNGYQGEYIKFAKFHDVDGDDVF